MIFVGVDWAEAHHDVYVQDETGRRLAGGRLAEGVEGIARFYDLVGGYVDQPDEVSSQLALGPGCSALAHRG